MIDRTILLIDSMRHWGEQISAIWAELFDLQNLRILLIDNVRQWGKQISAIWAEFFNLQNLPTPLIKKIYVICAN